MDNTCNNFYYDINNGLIMNVIKRFLIVIWTIIFACFVLFGGFFIFPVLRYIFTGKLNDPMDSLYSIFEYVLEHIESFFDNLSNIKNYKSNGQFWK